MNEVKADLLERSSELDRLAAFLSAARVGEGRLVLLGGEAGVGKTSLVHAFSESVKPSVRVLIGKCDPLSAPRPFGPLVDIGRAAGGELDRLLQQGAPQVQIFDALLRLLKLGTTPKVVVLEDVHWADEATLDLIRYLAPRLASVVALVIVTYRDDELGARHPLRVTIGDLATVPAVYRLKLEPLSLNAVRKLAAGSDLDPNLLHLRTGGNPFFVSEALAFQSTGVPPTVRDAVLARAARLSPAGRQTLEAAAIIGARSELWLVTDVSEAGIEDCLALGMLRSQGGMLNFRHELSRDAIVEAIAPGRHPVIHRAVLHALQQKPHHFNDLARLAHHAAGADDAEAVLAYAPQAAARAAAARAHREAAAQYARALRFAFSLPPGDRAGLLEKYAAECLASNQPEEAVEAVKAAAQIRRTELDRVEEAEDLELLSSSFNMLGRGAEAVQSCLSAIRILEQLPTTPQLALAYSWLAILRTEAGGRVEAISLGEKATEIAHQTGDAESEVMAALALGEACSYTGDTERARRLIEPALKIARDKSLERAIARALRDMALIGLHTRDHAMVEHNLRLLLEFAAERDFRDWQAFAPGWMARNCFHQGRWTEASDLAIAILRTENRNHNARFYALLTLGHLRARQGEHDEVGPLLDQALQLAASVGIFELLATARLARAEAAWLDGDRSRALSEVRSVYDRAVDAGEPWNIGELAFWAWRCGAENATSVIERCAQPYALQIAGRWEAAAAAWHERGREYEEAQALADSDSPAALRRALDQFDRLGARPAGAFVARRLRALGARDIPRGPHRSTRTHPHQLTEREVEILTLVAKGFRNREIADRLYLSSKTVDHHVSSILGKLGLRTRTEAATEFARWSTAWIKEPLLKR
jgi:DNA-binding CsgD family transcriptional regulator/tetratricopeptide (TPR) repeat protein